MIIKILRFIKKIIWVIIPPPNIPRTYSSSGEDAIVSFLLSDMHKSSVITYLEIGTGSPDGGNNTYLFYTLGSSGVCVEADKSLIPRIKKTRPRDKVYNVGVTAESEKEADFYVFSYGINTFDKEEAKVRASSGRFKLLEVVKVPLVNINSLIKENFKTYPDLLAIDIEGVDLAVLKTLDYKSYPIPIIIVETCLYSENHIHEKDYAPIEFMESIGYQVYADTYTNTIFVNKDWFNKVGAASTASKNIPDYAVFAGAPAKEVATRTQNLSYNLDYRPFLN